MTAFEILSKTIKERRSIFPPSYKLQEISDEVINDLLENANCAPTHRKTEPWRFRVMKGKALERLSQYLGDFYRENTPEEEFSDFKFKKTKKKALQCGCVIAICMKRDPTGSVPEWEEIAAVACAVQNMWLSCTSLNIGSYWSSPKAIYTMNEFLELEEEERCLGLFYMGYQKEGEYHTERGGLKNKVKWL